MTELLHEPDVAPNRFPLSATQELFCSDDLNFGPRFIMVTGWRIAGRIDVAALQGSLDDVVARHELLRTVVVRDVEPTYQQVHPPCPVPLEIRDLPPATDRSRDVRAEELLIEAERGTVNVRELPLLRAILGRFDDRDSVLIVMTHHSASDGWSTQLIMRDLAAFYAARTSHRPPKLPSVRQYREYAAWQRTDVADPASGNAREYWREKLRGARIFTLPNDRAIPKLQTRLYSAYDFAIHADAIAAMSALARAMRSSPFMPLLAAFNVLAYQITGTTDPVIPTLTSGRNEPQFQDTVGLFLNFLPFRTDIGGCVSFRDIVTRTRATCVEAYSREIPLQHIEREAPELMQPLEDARMCQLIFGMFQPPFDSATVQIADGSYEIQERVLPEQASSDLAGGLAWTMDLLSSGGLNGCVQYNPDEFDERTVVGWVSDYRRILSRAVSEPDREWKML